MWVPGPGHGGAEHSRGVCRHDHQGPALHLHREPVLHHALALQSERSQSGTGFEMFAESK